MHPLSHTPATEGSSTMNDRWSCSRLRKPELHRDINLKHDLLARDAGSRSPSSGSTMLINYNVWPPPPPPPFVSLDVTLYSGPTSLCRIIHIIPLFPLPFLSLRLRLSSLTQGYEDWLRHKADCSINECPVDVVQQGKVVRTQSHKLRVRMASLEQCSTWGHKATPQCCCITHFSNGPSHTHTHTRPF